MGIEQVIALIISAVVFVAVIGIPEWWRRCRERKAQRTTSDQAKQA